MVFTENAVPALRPVTFAALGGEVAIPPTTSRSNASTEFLAFEAGDIDLITRIGWSPSRNQWTDGTTVVAVTALQDLRRRKYCTRNSLDVISWPSVRWPAVPCCHRSEPVV
ncbi:hypothetical protein [Rhodococcus opacus]